MAPHFKREMGDSMLRFGSYDAENVGSYQTEVNNAADPRAHSPRVQDAKKTEIRDLLERGTFKIIFKEDIGPDGNVLPGGFVPAIKSTENGQVKYKARYVIGDHRENSRM